MNRTFIRFAVVLLTLVVAIAPVRADPAPAWNELLEQVDDAGLRTTLANSITIGLITDRAEFEATIARSHRRTDRTGRTGAPPSRGGVSDEIGRRCAGLAGKDVDAIKVTIDGRGRLFAPLAARLPSSYQAAVALAARFDPKVGTPELKDHEREIDAYLATIADDPVIKHALAVTGTRLDDLKANWFGAGAGFEHVICGEMKKTSVSGYHWWFKFYTDETAGRARLGQNIDHAGDTGIFTGRFTWDPDGNGPLPMLVKSKGGFTIGNSAQVLLALGHIAIETARKGNNVPSAVQFNANINGRAYTWQLYTLGGTIRSLYPICGSGDSAHSFDGVDAVYYDLEEDGLRALGADGSLTVH
ncbi:MAG: hypothetical protein GX442_18415 [Candidatus Riflebacteria bacterium]|nr:hypothetical protein [Candidatus Riflebacteria bacterium]